MSTGPLDLRMDLIQLSMVTMNTSSKLKGLDRQSLNDWIHLLSSEFVRVVTRLELVREGVALEPEADSWVLRLLPGSERDDPDQALRRELPKEPLLADVEEGGRRSEGLHSGPPIVVACGV